MTTRELPILFSAPMVRANKDGIKTNTRRTINRLLGFGPITEFGQSDTKGYDWHFRDRDGRWHDLRDAELREALPWRPGDLLWVREAWISWRWNDRVKPRDFVEKWGDQPARDYVGYLADNDISRPNSLGTLLEMDGKPRASIHMPRWASRLTLEVTAVKVERLQEINEEDAIAEGAIRMVGDGEGKFYAADHGSYRCGFVVIWTHINGVDSWDANPWVAAIAYKVYPRNIDQRDAA